MASDLLSDLAKRIAQYPYGNLTGNEGVDTTRDAFETRVLIALVLSQQDILERLIKIMANEFSLDDEGNAPHPEFLRGVKFCVDTVKSLQSVDPSG